MDVRPDGAGCEKANFIGYGVEALDGSIGKVDEATYDAGSAYIVVDTGPWIFGKKVMLPAGTIQRVDHEDEKILVSRTKDQIKNAPEFEEGIGTTRPTAVGSARTTRSTAAVGATGTES